MGIARDIKALRIQGASAIATESLKYLRKVAVQKGFGKEFWKIANGLESARPTAVVLHNCLEIIRNESSIMAMDLLIFKLVNDDRLIAKNGSNVIKSGFRVHTHCHSSEALGVIKAAASARNFSVIADETRPRYQGVKTARELSLVNNINVILAADSAAGFFASGISGKKDDIILVGADALRRGGLVNKIGTYQLALAAADNKIPFYVAASTLKIDKRKKFEIEMRDSSEIIKKRNQDKFSVANPAFDITPWKYVTAIITEKGVLKPSKLFV